MLNVVMLTISMLSVIKPTIYIECRNAVLQGVLFY
jgi:hypothetical protein